MSLLLGVLLASLPVAAARAQVAAPGFAPGPPALVLREIPSLGGAGFTPDNPAALLWSRRSLAGAAGVAHTTRDGSTGEDTRFAGRLAGVRLLGNNMAAAWEFLGGEEETPPPVFRQRLASYHFSARVSEDISWGLGRDVSRADDGTFAREVDALLLGAAARVAGVVFLGLALGNEAFREDTGPQREAFDRELRQFGAAVRLEGQPGLYAALERIEKDDFPESPARDERLVINRLVLQGLAWDVVLGLSYADLAHQDRRNFALIHLDLGYAPVEWLSLVLRASRFERKDAGQPPADRQETAVLLAAYRF